MGENKPYASQWNARQPYLMAIPSSGYGTPHHLRNKELTFHASNKTLHHSGEAMQERSPYSFHGTSAKAELDDVYTLNAEKGLFELQAREDIDAFRAYFKHMLTDRPMTLPIAGITDNIENFKHDHTSITDRNTVEPAIGQTYNLKGERLPHGATSLPRGIIIYNKKKHVVK